MLSRSILEQTTAELVMNIEIEGDFCGNCIVFVAQVGRVSIWHGETPEVDFNSMRQIGSGTSSDIYAAIQLTKTAMHVYIQMLGRDCQFSFCSDNRDEHGQRREKLIAKVFPAMINLGLYN